MRSVEHVKRCIAASRERPMVPIVYAVQIHPGSKQIRISRQPERRQVAPVTAAPQSNPLGVDVGTITQKCGRGQQIVILARARGTYSVGFAEREPIADSRTIVERQNDITAAREVLIERIGIAVV